MKMHKPANRARGLFLYCFLAVVTALTPVGCQREDRLHLSVEPQAQEVPMPMIGVCTSVGNADKLDAAGYDYIEESAQRFLTPLEPDAAFEANLKKFEMAPLPVRAFNGFLPEHLNCVGPEARHDAILAYARTAFERAERVGGQIIVFGSGRARRVPEGFALEGATEQFINLLKKIGPIANEYGIVVAIEPLNRQECNLITSVRDGAAIVRAVNHPNIRLLADIYHMTVEDEGPESIIEAGALIVHIHIAEKEGRTSPGVGGYDFVPYFAALRQIGYTGNISIECRWGDFDKEIAPALATVKEQLVEAQR